tara:strand:+ start:1785 stop:2210 length:426 start_codon:yes stop_codon:yes gene_type:complete
MFERPSWDEYFCKLATLTATRSSCDRLHVGCILVLDNRIIAQGYNGYLPGAQHTPLMREGHNVGTIHAEQNAVLDCAKRGVSCNGTTAYITHYPCFNCIKILATAGIKEIKYIEDYNNDPMVIDIADFAKIKIVHKPMIIH